MSAPKIIFLQWSEHPEAEVTWCEDQAAQDEDVDVEYVRKDIVNDLLAACETALGAFTMGMEDWMIQDAITECKAAIATAEEMGP
jgi:hypothetical protein